MYYWAREFSSALAAGKGYSSLPRTVIVSIVNFKMFDCDGFHSEHGALEVTRHTLLSDKMAYYFYELPKVPPYDGAGNMLQLWLLLFKAQTKEELEQIRALEVPIMTQAINAYYDITASPEFREKIRLYEKARHDEAQALYNMEKKTKEKIEKKIAAKIARKIARNALRMDM